MRVELISIRFEVRRSIHIPSMDGSEIVIERIRWGSSICWHLRHGKKRLITRRKEKIHHYVEQNRKNKTSYEIIDLGEY